MSIHVRLREWQSAGPGDVGTPELRGASLDGEDARALAKLLTKQDVVEIRELREGISVRARAHVGRVQLGNLIVTIEPKIGTSELLELFRYAYGLRNLRLFDERTAVDHTGRLLQDLIAAQLHAEVVELEKRGLVKQ